MNELHGIKIGRVLGQGTYGKVYEVTKDDKVYALKEQKLSEYDQGIAPAVLIETDTLKRTFHQNLVKTHDIFIGEDNKKIYYLLDKAVYDLEVYVNSKKCQASG